MIDADAYLRIPEAYGRWLGGLRWSTGGDAIEYPDGQTLVFGRELAEFLDGFAAGREPVHFAHVLHLAHLLLKGPLTSGLAVVPGLAAAGARPTRNVGALAALLCRDVPGLPDPPDVEAVRRVLTAGAAAADYRAIGREPDLLLWGGYGAIGLGPDEALDWPGPAADDPPMEPSAFEALVLDRCRRLTPEAIRTWLRTGAGPDPGGEAVAERAAAELPRTYREILEPLLDRPRLAGSAGLIDRLAGALALPPRRLARESLPTGGYADVSTRGAPERLLPSQHALDPDEFLRRFAERELLYYQREEPHAPESDELVVLLDQGVRTWGAVRTILAGAAVALGRLADRRGVPLRLASTGDPGPSIDPRQTPADALAERLEASDLSPDPGPSLAAVLAERPAGRRDVVLLTHPRSLAEPAVEAAARALGPGDRLFAVGVDEGRDVRLAELRGGRPVTLSRFRVEPVAPPPGRRRRPAPAGAGAPWTGDVEPIGYPFRFAPDAGSPIAFDEAGEWFLAVGPLGLPMAWRVDGTAAELWPRGLVGGEVVRRVDHALGVAGGFVLIGRLGDGDRPVAVHYDLVARRVRAYVKYLSPEPVWDWFYLRDSHALVARGPDERWYVDLRTGGRYSSQDRVSSETIARDLARVDDLPTPPPWLHVLHDDDTRPGSGPSIRLRRGTGTVVLDGLSEHWRPFRPFADGRPLLAGRRLVRALCRRWTLGLYVEGGGRPPAWHLFLGPAPVPLPDRGADGPDGLALSSDGRLVAVRAPGGRFAVYRAEAAGGPLLLTPRGGAAGSPWIGLGLGRLAIRGNGHAALFRWDRGPLEIVAGAGDAAEPIASQSRPGGPGVPLMAVARRGGLPPWAQYDRRRFKRTCRGPGLVAVGDTFGQVAVADASGTLLCLAYAERGRAAVWMPDGTRAGSFDLLGGPPTPGADDRIAAALRRASSRS